MDEYREGVARKTRLASEQKLREQEAEAAKAPQMPMAMPGQPTGGVGAQPWGMMGANPMMGFQNPADPSFQFLLRQQLLNAQNPQLNAFLLQQQLGGGAPGGMPGFPGQMGQFGQQSGMSQQGGGHAQGSVQAGQDPSQQNQGGQQQQQFSDMQQNQQDIINSMQNRMQASMYPGMMPQTQYGMPMGMMVGIPNANQDSNGGGGGGGGSSSMDQMSQQMQMGQQGQGGPSSGQWL